MGGSSTCYIFSIFCTRRFLFPRPLSITLLKYSIIISRSLFTRSSFCRFRNFLLFFDIFLFYFSNFSLGFYIFTNIGILDNGNIVGRFCVWFYILFFNWITFLSPYSRNDDGMVFWAQTYQKSGYVLILRQITDIHLFYNLQIFYWHFLELLWLFIFLVLYLQ